MSRSSSRLPSLLGYTMSTGGGRTTLLDLGLPLEWFTSDLQRHLVAHRMCNLPTMTVLLTLSAPQRTAEHVVLAVRQRPRNGQPPTGVPSAVS